MAVVLRERIRERIGSVLSRRSSGMAHCVFFVSLLVLCLNNILFSMSKWGDSRAPVNDAPASSSSSSFSANDENEENEDCHGLEGARVLLVNLHLEGNLGDELETTPFLKELKRCKIVTVALLSTWIPYPQSLDARSIREHHLIDDIVTRYPDESELHSSYDATIECPGPHRALGIGDEQGLRFEDIYFGGTLPIPKGRNWTKHHHDEIRRGANDKVRLIAVREPASMHDLTKYNISTSLYMMGDLANVYEPIWSIVKYWEDAYQKEYPSVKNIVYIRSKNFDESIEAIDQNTTLLLKPFSSKTAPIKLSMGNMLIVSNSVVEDGELWKDLGTGVKKIEGVRPDQYLMLDTTEQLFALTRQAKNVYTSRYHPGVIGHRLGKNVELLAWQPGQKKLRGLQQIIEEFPDVRILQDERIPTGFKKMRDALRSLRTEKNRTALVTAARSTTENA